MGDWDLTKKMNKAAALRERKKGNIYFTWQAQCYHCGLLIEGSYFIDETPDIISAISEMTNVEGEGLHCPTCFAIDKKQDWLNTFIGKRVETLRPITNSKSDDSYSSWSWTELEAGKRGTIVEVKLGYPYYWDRDEIGVDSVKVRFDKDVKYSDTWFGVNEVKVL